MRLGPRYLLRRLVALAATLVLAPTLAYAVFTTLHGADEGFLALAWHYAVRTFWHFDLGVAESYQEPVTTVIAGAWQVDLVLLLGALGLGLGLGLGGGLLVSRRGGGAGSRTLQVATAAVLACPPYFLGFTALILFGAGTGRIASLGFVSGLGDYVPLHESPLRWLQALWVPWLVTALPLAAGVLRMTAASLRDGDGEEFVRTARAKGLPERAVRRRHLLPLAVAPVASLTATNVAFLVTNVALVESAFNLPGMYREITRLGNFADYDLIQAIILEVVVVIVVLNTIAELVQARLDPAVR